MNQSQLLTRAIAEKISNDITRLQELQSSAVVTPTRDQEIAALEQSLSGALLQFAPELISAWFVSKLEYEPLMGALANTFNRVNQINHARARMQQAIAEQKENVVKVFTSPEAK